ncbi:hypothetical protein KM043_017819 [Ampulex compressa]|nr:hypothetical protein KM043_017819 [Ampulex compressa]
MANQYAKGDFPGRKSGQEKDRRSGKKARGRKGDSGYDIRAKGRGGGTETESPLAAEPYFHLRRNKPILFPVALEVAIPSKSLLIGPHST